MSGNVCASAEPGIASSGGLDGGAKSRVYTSDVFKPGLSLTRLELEGKIEGLKKLEINRSSFKLFKPSFFSNNLLICNYIFSVSQKIYLF